MKYLTLLIFTSPAILALPFSEVATATTTTNKPRLLPRQSSVPFFPSDFFQGTEISSDVSYLPTNGAVGTDQDPCVPEVTSVGAFAATTKIKGQADVTATWEAVLPETTLEWPFLEGPPIVIGGDDEDEDDTPCVL